MTPNSLSNEVRFAGAREGAGGEGEQIEKVQFGTRKRRRGAGPTQGKNDAEDGQVYDTMTVATNGPTGKRKRPRAVQETS